MSHYSGDILSLLYTSPAGLFLRSTQTRGIHLLSAEVSAGLSVNPFSRTLSCWASRDSHIGWLSGFTQFRAVTIYTNIQRPCQSIYAYPAEILILFLRSVSCYVLFATNDRRRGLTAIRQSHTLSV